MGPERESSSGGGGQYQTGSTGHRTASVSQTAALGHRSAVISARVSDVWDDGGWFDTPRSQPLADVRPATAEIPRTRQGSLSLNSDVAAHEW